MIRTTVFVAAATLLISVTSAGWADGWTGPIRISDGTGSALYPRIAAQTGGYGHHVHAVWRGVDGTRVLYRRSSDGGQTWGSTVTLYSGGTLFPHIAVSGHTVHVICDGDSGSIKYYRSTNDGGTWDPVVNLHTTSPETRGDMPDVAAYLDSVYVVWVKTYGQFDVVFRYSTDNGRTWSNSVSLTTDAAEEKYPRVAGWGSNAYVIWTTSTGVYYRRGPVWWTPAVALWTGEYRASIAAYSSLVYVDRSDAANGPAQKLSTDSGTTFSSDIWLGYGDEWPEVDASEAYAGNGCTSFFDTRSGIQKVFVSTYPRGETQIGTITGSTMNGDIAGTDDGAMHVVVNSSATHDVYYYRYDAPRDFVPWQPPPSVTGIHQSDAQWGDFDGDGDLDLVICGVSGYPTGPVVTQTYENRAGTLVLKQSLEGVQSEGSGNLAWGDYDGDGDLDLAIAGTSASGSIARIYKNNGSGVLTWDTAQVLTGVAQASVAWGDYDGDGDLDLLVMGHDGTKAVTTLYKNHPLGTLKPDTTQSLTGLYCGSADWADWDGDGDLDLVTTGNDGTTGRTIFYKNNGQGTLVNDGAHGLPGVYLSDTAWGDFDHDGDLDLAITGNQGVAGNHVARVYANDGAGNFTQMGNNLLSIYRSSCAWGDYDNDGDLDVAFMGYTGTGLLTRIYENEAGAFSSAFSLAGLSEGSLTWADVNQDGDLDLFATGQYNWQSANADLYRNVGGLPNTPPTAPTQLAQQWVSQGLRLSWSGAGDRETPAAGLYYCLRVGTSPGANNVVSGTYGTPLMGNVGQATSLVLRVSSGTYYWSVRAIDSGLMASPWSVESVAAPASCPGDFNCDGQIDFRDIDPFVAVLAGGTCCDGTGANCDVNGDGTVDFGDIDPFVALLSAGATCP